MLAKLSNFIAIFIFSQFLIGCENPREIVKAGKNFIKPSVNIFKKQDKLAKENYDSHNYLKAGELYSKLAKEYPDELYYLLMAGNSFRLAGKPTEARSYYDQILLSINNEKYALDAKEGRSLSLLQEGRFEEALAIFNEVIAEDATRWKTINALGVVLALNNKSKEALEYYDLALAVSNNNYSILNNKALTLAFMGKKKEAIHVMEHASAQVANHPSAKKKIDLNLALLYGINGLYTQAENILSNHLTPEQIKTNLEFYKNLQENELLEHEYIEQALSGKKNKNKIK